MAKRQRTSRLGQSRTWLRTQITRAASSPAGLSRGTGAARGIPHRITAPNTAEKESTPSPATSTPPKDPLWSKRRWLISIAAMMIGALIAILAVYLANDNTLSSEQKLPSLTVGGAVDAGRTFDYATMGSCLHWDISESDGSLINFRRVDCASEHRFEVAGIIDLDRYPSQRFDKDSAPLSPVHVESLRQGLCRPLVDSYLPKGLDPAGRFRVGILEPGVDAWNAGTRILVCGIEASIANTDQPIFTKLVADQSQSLMWPAGTCLTYIPNTQMPGAVVNCDNDHFIEVVGTINLSEKFGDTMPTTKQQNSYAEKHCVDMSTTYVGGVEKLRKTTLTPVWTRVSLAGWNAGTRTVNCYLSKSGKGGLATLEYSARSDKLQINGRKPRKVKPLPPKGNQQLPDMHHDPLLNDSVPSGF